jgi:threonine aldolase
MKRIDLRSDTVTKPTNAMRQAMAQADVGDDVYHEDPTVNRLEALAAEVLGKESALFVTSGTQGNQIAILAHTDRGDEIILEAESHIFYYEAAAASTLAGVQLRTIVGNRGAMDLVTVEQAIRPKNIHFPRTALICLENTHNRAGGAILTPSYMQKIAGIAKLHHTPIHLDGARLFNAVVKVGQDVKAFTQHTDTVQVCLSKGLGAPIGSLLAGSTAFIEKARTWRKRLGGGMRQVGVLAAPGIIALTEMVERLAEDHQHATMLAEGLANISGLAVDVASVETNIVMVCITSPKLTAQPLVEQLQQEGVLCNAVDDATIRLVTHKDITLSDIETTLHKINDMLHS